MADGSCGPGGSRGSCESDWLGGSGQPSGSCELWVWLGLEMCKMLNVSQPFRLNTTDPLNRLQI